jgi:hypothetical protein
MSFEGVLESVLGYPLLDNSSKLCVLLLFNLFDFLGMSVSVLSELLMKLCILDEVYSSSHLVCAQKLALDSLMITVTVL